MNVEKRLPRGLIEVSNQCRKNCLYCGIRSGNAALKRYHLSEAEVLSAAEEAVRRGYPAIALQAGESESEENTAFYEKVLRELPENLEVTLSLGEQTEEVYRRWKTAAGKRTLRYLLRIETSNRGLFEKIHPSGTEGERGLHSFDRRVECIRTLKKLGYVTGSGVMIGLPGQSKADLERDLDWFEEMKLDMVGMGPYIPAEGTPLAAEKVISEKERLELTLWMIGEVRRRMPEVNIVSATALEVLEAGARELGFKAGANVYMPNLTPAFAREKYSLYPGKSEADVPLVEVKDLKIAFNLGGRRSVPVRNVSFSLPRNSRVALVGESGSGKSLTALALGGLVDRAEISGTIVSSARIAYIFQNPMQSLNPVMKVGRQIEEGMRRGEGEDKREVSELLESVGLPSETAGKYPCQLSGGQQQRVMIAMALAQKPDLLIADEPTTALDVTTQKEVLELIDRIADERKMSVLLITHNLGLVKEHSRYVNVMYAGEIVEAGPVSEVLGGPRHPYTKGLLAAVPRLDAPKDAPLKDIPGTVPPPTAWPSGCAFHPRCPEAKPGCATDDYPCRRRM